jgi:ferrous iron transport protein A
MASLDPRAQTMNATAPLVLLSSMALHEPATVQAVTAPSHAPEWADWLAQIGFLPGEMVTLTARARPGGDPLVVRVGDSTFALRRAEAECVQVLPRLAGAEWSAA